MSYNLLIVDDSRSMRSVIKKVLEMAGFVDGNYYEAGHGKEALEVLKHEKIDLVLSDINMPEMDGMRLLDSIRNNIDTKTLPVIIISTEGSEERKKEADRLGANGYLQKPFQPEMVRSILHESLGWIYDDESESF